MTACDCSSFLLFFILAVHRMKRVLLWSIFITFNLLVDQSSPFTVYFKASLPAKVCYWYVFVRVEIRTNYHKKNLALNLILRCKYTQTATIVQPSDRRSWLDLQLKLEMCFFWFDSRFRFCLIDIRVYFPKEPYQSQLDLKG